MPLSVIFKGTDYLQSLITAIKTLLRKKKKKTQFLLGMVVCAYNPALVNRGRRISSSSLA
jgi:hypothetical protein